MPTIQGAEPRQLLACAHCGGIPCMRRYAAVECGEIEWFTFDAKQEEANDK
jgi:hypothetical protein